MTWYVALTLLVSIPLALQFIRERRLFRRLGPVLVDCGRSPRLGAWHIFGAVLFTAFGLANTLFSGAGPIPVYPLPGPFLFIVIAASQWATLLNPVQIRSGGVVTVSGGLPWEVFKSGYWINATTVVFQTRSRCTFTLDVPRRRRTRSVRSSIERWRSRINRRLLKSTLARRYPVRIGPCHPFERTVRLDSPESPEERR